jgi:hemoglobin-like flavoprotein
MTDQKKKLVGMLGNVIASLHRLEVILPSIAGLGRRHVDYGVAEKDYGTMAAALFWTLEQGLGDAWNPEVKAAWTAVYVTLPGAMVEAGQASAG